MRPAASVFSGAITSAGGRYAGDAGHVVVRDAALVSHASGRLLISGAACHGARRCLALTGRPVGSLKLTGHPMTLTLAARRGWLKVATATPLRCAAARRADRVAGG